MFKHSPTAKVLLHVANLTVIVFILLPLVAVFIGSMMNRITRPLPRCMSRRGSPLGSMAQPIRR